MTGEYYTKFRAVASNAGGIVATHGAGRRKKGANERIVRASLIAFGEKPG